MTSTGAPDYRALAKRWKPLVEQLAGSNRGPMRIRRFREAIMQNSYNTAITNLQSMMPLSAGQMTAPVIAALQGILDILESLRAYTDGSDEQLDQAFATLKDSI